MSQELSIHWVNKVHLAQWWEKESDFYDFAAFVMSFLNNTQCSNSVVTCIIHITKSFILTE